MTEHRRPHFAKLIRISFEEEDLLRRRANELHISQTDLIRLLLVNFCNKIRVRVADSAEQQEA